MGCFIEELKDSGRAFRDFLVKHQLLLVLTGLLSFLACSPLLVHSGDILTDSETYVTNLQDTLNTFIKVGRFGIVLTKQVFSTDAYVPVLFALYTMAAMWLACILFDFCISQAAGDKGKTWEPFYYIFNALYLTSPIFPNQFYFIYQAFEVALAFCFCIAAAYCAFQAVYEEKSPWWCVLAAGFMIWGFATYQVLVPYYIALNSALYVIYDLFHKRELKKSRFVLCLQLVALFLSGLIAYLILSKGIIALLFDLNGTTHLTDTYSCWMRLGPEQCLENVVGDLKRIFLHEIPVPAYNRFFAPIAAAAASLLCYYRYRQKKPGAVLLTAAVCITICSVFFMTFLLGNYQIVRSQMVLPFVMAFCGASLAAIPCQKRRMVAGMMCIIMALLTGNQLKTSHRCYETMHRTAVNDQNLAREIYGQTGSYRDPANPGAVPMVFVGKKESVLPLSNIFAWDALGLSFFDIDHDSVQGSVRIARYMKCLGLQTGEPLPEQYEYAVDQAESMTCWPAEGSVVFQEGIIIVKLSEPSSQ